MLLNRTRIHSLPTAHLYGIFTDIALGEARFLVSWLRQCWHFQIVIVYGLSLNMEQSKRMRQ